MVVAPVKLVVDNIVDLANAFIQPIFIQILTFGIQVFPVILSFWYNADRVADSSLFQNPLKPETYDFIVGKCKEGFNVIIVKTLILKKNKHEIVEHLLNSWGWMRRFYRCKQTQPKIQCTCVGVWW